MRRYGLFLWVFFLIGGSVGAQDLPTRADLSAGWNRIEPGGATICARGTPYMFYVREGSSDNLLIDFQGGGACWNDLTCSTQFGTFDDSISISEPYDNPAIDGNGIFDLDNPDNPFADYDMVFVPYCTGDVHLGDSIVTYEAADGAFDIHYNGFTNATTALEWAYANFAAPESVFVSGCSAGSLGASFHAPNIIAHYADVRSAVLGDSAGGYRGNQTAQFEQWNTLSVLPDLEQYADMTLESLSFQQFWVKAAFQFPGTQFTQYNTAFDETQTYFARISGTGVQYADALPANLSEIAAQVANFASYTAGGDQHCVFPRPEFYTYTVGALRFRDWVAELAAGDPVATVACTDCETVETITP